MSDEVLQRMPEKNTCTDTYDGICVLRAAAEQFFNNKDFVHPELADMFPCDYELVIGNAVTSIPSAKALPEVTMKRSDIVLKQQAQFSGINGAVVVPTFTLDFEIKTPSYRMTELRAQELSRFIATFTPYFRGYNLTIGSVVCGATQHFREASPNYYFATVRVSAGIPITQWTYSENASILRSITVALNIRGGAEPPIVLN